MHFFWECIGCFFFWCRSHTHARCESSPLHWFRVNWIELPYFFVPSIFCCWHFLAKIHTHMARNWFQLCFLSLFHTLEQVWFCLWFRCFQHISYFFFSYLFSLCLGDVVGSFCAKCYLSVMASSLFPCPTKYNNTKIVLNLYLQHW